MKGENRTDAARQKGWAYALKAYPFLDGDRAAALGASYGGFMVNWIASQWKCWHLRS